HIGPAWTMLRAISIRNPHHKPFMRWLVHQKGLCELCSKAHKMHFSHFFLVFLHFSIFFNQTFYFLKLFQSHSASFACFVACIYFFLVTFGCIFPTLTFLLCTFSAFLADNNHQRLAFIYAYVCFALCA